MILRYAEQGMTPAGIALAIRRAHSFADIFRLVLAEEEARLAQEANEATQKKEG